MWIDLLQLINFRSYGKRSFRLKEGTNLITGPNGAGKTNLLEAILFASTTASHRTSGNSKLLREGEEAFSVKAGAFGRKGRFRVEVVYRKGSGTKVRVNSSPVKRESLLAGFPAVMFSPEDIDVVKGPPSGLRRMFNINICQLCPRYTAGLIKYRRALQERNTALKKGGTAGLEPWTGILRKYSEELTGERKRFLERLGRVMREVAEEIGLESPPEIHYRPSRYRESSLEKDIEAGFTTWGPHRDIFIFLESGRNMRDTGSRGQARMAAILYRVSLWRMLRESSGTEPVFLMDDVFSELDPEKRRLVAGCVSARQTLLTAARPPEELEGKANVIRLR